MREMAFLNKGVKLVLRDERGDKEREKVFKYDGGIIEMVKYLNKSKNPIVEDIIYIDEEKDGQEVEIALQYTDGYSENIISFANNIHTPEGGAHLSGFRTALTRIVNDYGRKNKILKDNEPNLSGDDAREGLTGVISVKLPQPQFEGQTKAKLGNSETSGIVNAVVGEKLAQYFEENPRVAKLILDKAVKSQRAREAARKAREVSRNRSILESTALPGKLAECQSNDNSITEIFIVEGDSAGGSAKQGRDKHYQAILPLRGKIMNVEKARLDKVLGYQEIKSMITAFGTGIGEDFDIEKLRYGKIIIMTDADVDGAHIRTLLLTFFFRYMPELITGGHVYIAQPPLYKVTKGRNEKYCYSDKELDEYLDEIGREGITLQRYKGLGEMNFDQLWDTTMDPEKRVLLKANIEDMGYSDEVFSMLMGDKVQPRREFIEENARYVSNLDV